MDGEATDLAVRLASVRAGVLVTLLVCAGAAVDVVLWADPDRRVALAGILGLAALGACGTALLPWEKIVRSEHREAAFISWSLSTVILITAFGLAENRPNSALSLMFFVPIVFVSMTYPLRSLIVVSATAIGAYFAVAMSVGSSPDFLFMFVAVLFFTALMGGWQARNHDRVREELARVSRTDPLTGCLNRRGFEKRAEAAVAAAVAAGEQLTVILVDLDGFKQVNDTEGHAAGDTVLRDVAAQLAEAGGPDAVIGRLGGDEFAVLMRGVGPDDALAAADGIESAVASVNRASVGVAVLETPTAALDALIGSADRRLYETKLRRRAGSRTLDDIELSPGMPGFVS
jgi:diguanylate cyclase (GGDEF)-like protein